MDAWEFPKHIFPGVYIVVCAVIPFDMAGLVSASIKEQLC